MSWKENKLVGIIALIVLVLSIVFAVNQLLSRNKQMPQDPPVDTSSEIPGPPPGLGGQ